MFTRGLRVGTSEVVLTEDGGVYSATFSPKKAYCAPGTFPWEEPTAHTVDTYTLWWSPNRRRIYGTEREDYVSGDCRGTVTRKWLAVRTDPTETLPAAGP